MEWDWLYPVGTAVVALAGIGATLLTAAQARSHAERLATAEHEHAHQEMLRQDRLKAYADALAHAVDEERKLNATWATNGERAYDLSIKPPGAKILLASVDEISVRMRLLADEDVEQAWHAFLCAWEEYQWWAQHEFSGDPNEEAPEHLTTSLADAIDRLKGACRSSVQ